MRWQLPISYLARETAPSWLGRHFLLAWHLVLLAVSFYPFSGWRYTGEGIFAFYSYPLPYYQTAFDNWINVAAYMPLGYAWALYYRCRWFAPLLAMLLGCLLSGSVEFVQQFIPSRIASNLDILCNTTGCLLGALAAGLFSKLLILRGWHIRRQRWFRVGALADYGLMLLALWFATQMNPAIPLFGVVVQPRGLPQPWVSPIHDAALFLGVLEISGVMLHFTAVCLFLLTLLAQRSDRMTALWGLVLAAVTLKLVTAGALLKPSAFLEWFNLQVLAGILAALILLNILSRLKMRWQALAAAACLFATQVIEELWPLNAEPLDMLNLFKWRYGHLRDFNGLSEMISAVWPYAATVYLLGLAWQNWRRSHMPTIIGKR